MPSGRPDPVFPFASCAIRVAWRVGGGRSKTGEQRR